MYKTNGLQANVTGGASTSLTYDLNGNLLNDGTNSYAWDAENRMIKITYPGTGNYSTFVADCKGRLATITETTGGSVTSTRQFIWSGDFMRECRDGSGSIISQYFKHGQITSGSNTFYTRDRLNSIRDITGGAGSSIDAISYDPFGNIVTDTGVAGADFKFAGYYQH